MTIGAFGYRRPAFWSPGRKPGPARQIELDGNASLSRNLRLITLFDGSAGSFSNGGRDYVLPSRSITINGSVNHDWAQGGSYLATSTVNSCLSLSPAITSLTNWSISNLVLFDGTIANTNTIVIGGDDIDNNPWYIQGTADPVPGAFTSNGNSTAIGALRINQLTGWHRITATWNNATATQTMYLDGQSFGSVTGINTPITSITGLLGNLASAGHSFLLKTADYFIWNRTLTASDVAGHFAKPYDVLRPRFRQLARSPVAQTAVASPFSGDFSPDFGAVGGAGAQLWPANAFPVGSGAVTANTTILVAGTGDPWSVDFSVDFGPRGLIQANANIAASGNVVAPATHPVTASASLAGVSSVSAQALAAVISVSPWSVDFSADFGGVSVNPVTWSATASLSATGQIAPRAIVRADGRATLPAAGSVFALPNPPVFAQGVTVGTAAGVGTATGVGAATMRTVGTASAVGQAIGVATAATAGGGYSRILRTQNGVPILSGTSVGPTPVPLYAAYREITDAVGVPFYIAEIAAFQPGDGAVTFSVGYNGAAWGALSLKPFSIESTGTLLASDIGYRTQSTDPDGVVPYPPMLVEAFAIDRQMSLDPGQTAAAWSWGDISLANDDGRWDGIAASWNSDHRPVSILRGSKSWDDRRGIWLDPPYANMVAMFIGVATPWFLGATTLKVPLRDATYWIEQPLQPNHFGGNGLYDGTPEIAGKPFPIARGGTSDNPIQNVTPMLIDPVYLIYQFNDARGTVEALFEGGAPTITFAGFSTNLYSGATPPGQYRVDTSRGLFQLGSVPVHAITANVTGAFRVNGVVSTVAAIAKNLLLDDLQIPAENIDSQSFGDADIAYPFIGGFYWHPDNQVDGVTALSDVLGSFGAKLISDRYGRLRCFVLRALQASQPTGNVLDTTNCVSITPVPLPTAVDPPPYRLRLAYSRNYTVQTSDMNATAPVTQLQFAATPEPYATWFSSSILTQYRRPNDTAPISGGLLVKDDAQSVVDQLGTLWGSRARLYEVVVPVEVGLGIDLGDVVRLVYPMDDLRNGRVGNVVGIQFRSPDATMTLRVLVTRNTLGSIPPGPLTGVGVV